MIRRHGCRLPDHSQNTLMLSALRAEISGSAAPKDFSNLAAVDGLAFGKAGVGAADRRHWSAGKICGPTSARDG
ncbi:hypothetical protein IE4771_PD00428 (plasmid) [Rhizobium etli bv. mimosae str. IE4771]|uniref:Uncharacterized protein n=1 Tax=Rhizobium etli bv. mimosae str. IE4771 TaxID=1432050 RepID=A0A060I7N8_RHIET|nr:hypothetical protein REMIM1_PF00489 [Rhizobium etli bv. mimosae str. Mim1]AIC30983.1 hypothetical protein IE4771_PD00428 [Rhizobium sp. IE4771]